MRYRSFDLIESFRVNIPPVAFRRYLSVFLSFHLVISVSLGGSVVSSFAWRGDCSIRGAGMRWTGSMYGGYMIHRRCTQRACRVERHRPTAHH